VWGFGLGGGGGGPPDHLPPPPPSFWRGVRTPPLLAGHQSLSRVIHITQELHLLDESLPALTPDCFFPPFRVLDFG
jgi:hypothetical protein